MFKRILLLIGWGVLTQVAVAQVGIGTTTPNDKAILELVSNNKGLLMPRLTTAQRDAMGLGAAEEGMVIYNSTLAKMQYWNGANWSDVGAGGAGIQNQFASAQSADFWISGNGRVGNNLAVDGIMINNYGLLEMGGSFSNRIMYNDNGIAPPTFNTRSAGTKIVFFDALSATATDIALGVGSGEFWLTIPDNSKQFRFYAGTSPLFTLKGNGSVELDNAIINRKLVLYNYNTNDHEYSGFGINSGVLRYQVPAMSNSHVFYAAQDATSSFELMRIRGDGRVGIGSSSPASMLSVGFNGFQVDDAGNILAIRGVTTSFPNVQGGAGTFLQNDGSGNLSWATAGTGSGWSLTGNAGTTASDFLGTTDNVALRFKIGGKQAGYIADSLSNNNVFWGIDAGKSQTTGFNNTGIGFHTLKNTTSGINNTAQGFEAMYGNQNGTSNTAVGTVALYSNISGNSNTAVGAFSLYSNDYGESNTASGYYALYSNTNGTNNSAYGADALEYNTFGINNTAMGSMALFQNTSNYNTAIGTQAMFNNTTGTNSVAIGNQALLNNTTGRQNVVVGASSMTNGNHNRVTAIGTEIDISTNRSNIIAIGYGINDGHITSDNMTRIGNSSISQTDIAGRLTYNAQSAVSNTFPADRGSNGQVLATDGDGLLYWTNAGAGSGWGLSGNAGTTASDFIGTTDDVSLTFKINGNQSGFIANSSTNNSVFLGYRAGKAQTTGLNNTGIGHQTLENTTSGNNNTAYGFNTMYGNDGGNHNTAVGSVALFGNTSGSSNTSLGANTLYNNTTGSSNTVAGESAMYLNTTGKNNTAYGYQTLMYNTGTSYNTAVGNRALYQSTASYNTAVGNQALFNNTTGTYNTALGNQALMTNSTGTYNTVVGSSALFANTTGSQNVVVGESALINGNHSRVVALGSQITISTDRSNVIAIGYGIGDANITSNDMTRIGNNATIKTDIAGTLSYNVQDGSASNTFPANRGTNGQFLKTDGTGTLSWANISGDNLGNHLMTSNLITDNHWITGDNDPEGIFVNYSGKVGIGISTPTAFLHINDPGSSQGDLRLTAGTVTGTSGADGLAISINGAAANIISYENLPMYFGTNGANRVTISGAGNLGVGTTSPICPLDVSGTTAFGPLSALYFNSSTSNTSTLTGASSVSAAVSVRATGAFLSLGAGSNGGFYTTSDRRIKDVVGLSNTAQDLATLRNIRITDYRFKDSLNAGNMAVKGVIAQELEAVYPQAVSKQTNTIPNVYALSKTVQYDPQTRRLTVTLAKTPELNAGDKVKLITQEGGEQMATVAEVNGNSFVVKDWEKAVNQIFVYGKEVNDFRIVDYDRLSVLNVAAVQELAKVKDQQAAKIQELEMRLQESQQTIQSLRNDFEVRLRNVEAKLQPKVAAIGK
ncbi:Chaperone of endosialidase [Flexibacter flexilis DSM 6793]|uniref:Chaperone of endosialidase n=1 Tax=Flexibacter flexilis DSM 6793 TaxID=927664 RepID=A0A1I1M9M7_9BACT|nr:tail fiber domain-containing protein [Flexibacter flexilis]SFC82217.1 Chaperone of endosialidase [Flexibacter flexilis DSM 6793]